MRKVYIVFDKVSNICAGTPFLAHSDDEAVRIFHFAAKSSPFRRDLELRFLFNLDDISSQFVSDFSEAYLKQYGDLVFDEDDRAKEQYMEAFSNINTKGDNKDEKSS